MTQYAEDVRLTVYAKGVDTLGGSVDFTRREDELGGLDSLGGSRAKPLEARSETLRSKIRVLDKNETITDQIFDNSTGEPVILDRLFEIEIRWDGGSWQRVAAGRVIDVHQTEAVREYEFEIADEGQLLRERSAFAPDNPQPFGGGADTVSILPRGVIDKWRNFEALRPIKYKVEDLKGGSNEAVLILLGGDIDAGGEDWRKGPASLTDEIQEVIADDLREDAVALTYNLEPSLSEGRGDFKTLRFHDVGSDADKELFASGDLVGGFGPDGEWKEAMKRPRDLWVYWPGNSLSVGDTGECYLYMPGHKPTDVLPLHFGGENGVDRWQHLKDGLDAAQVRYDTSAVNDLIGQGEKIWPRATEDLSFLEHLRRAVLHPSGYMLAPNESGELTPIRVAVPRAEEVPDINNVPLVDKDSISGPDYPSWGHTRDDQVTVLKFQCHMVQGPFEVSYVGPPTKGDPETIWPDSDGAADGLRESTFEIEKTHEVDTYGRREVEVHLSGLEKRQDFERVASDLAEMIFARWGGGAIMSKFGLLKTHEAESVGNFLRIDLDDFPNGSLNARGGERLVQIIERSKDLRPGIEVTTLDAGAANQPLQTPTIDSVSQNANRPESAVDLSVSLGADAGSWVVQFAKATTDPADSSDAWGRKAAFPASQTTGTVYGLEAGTEYWVRARALASQRIGSAWSSHSNIITGGLGSITNGSVTDITGSQALATWTVPNDDQPVQLTLRNTTAGRTEISQRLDAGAEEKLLDGLSSGDSYELDIQLVDDAGKANGPITTVSFTAGSSNDQLPQPDFIGVQYGRKSHRGERAASAATGVALWSVAADPATPLVFQRAPDDGAGNPDTANISDFKQELGITQFIDTGVNPGDGPYWYRVLHRAPGYTDSVPSEWVKAWPVALPDQIGSPPTKPLVDIDVRIDDQGNISLFFDGEPRVKAFRYDICTTDSGSCSGFGSIDAETGTLETTDSDGDKDLTNVDSLPKGETVYVEVAAYPDEAGEDSPLAFRSTSRQRAGADAAAAIEPEARLRQDSVEPDKILYDLWADGGSDVADPNLRYRLKVDGPGQDSDYGGWTNIADADLGSWINREISIRRPFQHPALLTVQVEDQAPSTGPRTTAQIPIEGTWEGQDHTGGRREREERGGRVGGELPALASTYHELKSRDGSQQVYDPVAQAFRKVDYRDDSDNVLIDRGGYVESSLARESGGPSMRRTFAKPTAGDPDNVDSVPAGTSFVRLAAGYADGSERPTTVRDTSSARDIAGGEVFAKPAAGDPDDLDSVPDGASWQRITSGYVDGSGRVDQVRDPASARDIGGGEVFKKPASGDPDDLDSVPDSTSWHRTSTGYQDGSGRPTTLRDTAAARDKAADDIFDHTFEDADVISDGASYGTVAVGYTDGSKRPDTVRDPASARDIGGGEVFKKAASGDPDDMDSVPDSSARVAGASGYFDGSNRPTTVRDPASARDIGGGEVFKKPASGDPDDARSVQAGKAGAGSASDAVADRVQGLLGTGGVDGGTEFNGRVASEVQEQAGAGSQGDVAVAFDGSGDYIALDDSYASSGITPGFVVMAWIKTAVGKGIIASYDRNEYWRFEVGGTSAADGNLGLGFYDSANDTVRDIDSGVAVNDGEWHWVAVTYDSSTGDVRFYVDGKFALDSAISTPATGGFGTGNTRFGAIGINSEMGSFDGSVSTSSTDFDGQIADVRIYKKHWLNNSDTVEDWNRGLSGDENGLDLYYPMAQGFGPDIYDYASAGGASDGVFRGDAKWARRPKLDALTDVQNPPLEAGATSDPATIETFQLVSYNVGGTSACNGALDIELEWKIGGWDSDKFSLSLEYWGDWDADGVFDVKSTDTPVQDGDIMASSEHYTWSNMPYADDNNCTAVDSYVKLIVTRDSTGEAIDSAVTRDLRYNTHLCLDNQCARQSGFE